MADTATAADTASAADTATAVDAAATTPGTAADTANTSAKVRAAGAASSAAAADTSPSKLAHAAAAGAGAGSAAGAGAGSASGGVPKATEATPTSLTVTWDATPGPAATYAVQMSTDPSVADGSWKLLSSSLKACTLRKKNLAPNTAHYFRIRALNEAGEGASEWGMPSPPLRTAVGVDPIFRNLLGSQVLRNARGKPGAAAPVDLSELGGGLVALYFSASWCPPCRQFTPSLVAFHDAVRRAGGPGKFEVVFVSSDQDQHSFDEYFANHHGGWFALPFAAQTQRQQCGSYFKVEGIPRLIVFGPDGKIVCSNAVGEHLDFATLARWQAQAGAAPKI
jgi:thiol-disulfide isomerase/thioredoxin